MAGPRTLEAPAHRKDGGILRQNWENVDIVPAVDTAKKEAYK